jgi:hypothetical protein
MSHVTPGRFATARATRTSFRALLHNNRVLHLTGLATSRFEFSGMTDAERESEYAPYATIGDQMVA